MKSTTQEEITKLEAKLAEVAFELAYFKAWGFLETLAETATNSVYPVFHSLYGETAKSFGEYDFAPTWSKVVYVDVVKSAISRAKRQTNCKKNPTWAKRALEAAQVVDKYIAVESN